MKTADYVESHLLNPDSRATWHIDLTIAPIAMDRPCSVRPSAQKSSQTTMEASVRRSARRLVAAAIPPSLRPPSLPYSALLHYAAADAVAVAAYSLIDWRRIGEPSQILLPPEPYFLIEHFDWWCQAGRL